MKTKLLFLFLLSVLLISACNSKKGGSHNESRSVDSSTEAVEPLSEEEPKEELTATQKLPDLVIWSGSRSPGGLVSPGTKCTFTFEVRNIGAENYTGHIVVGAPGVLASGFTGLNKGETKEAVVNFTATSKGAKYELRFTVDPDNVITESDESNNKSQLYIIQTTN